MKKNVMNNFHYQNFFNN